MTTETTMYRVTASYERDGLLLDASQAEVLGDAYGRTYATEAEAEAVAQELADTIADYGLDPTTTYSVEPVR